MKKLLILLFSLLISFNSYGGLFDKTVCVETEIVERGGLIYLPNKTKPFSGKNLCEYPSGQYKSQGKIKKGVKDGKWTYWFENGEIKPESEYKDGVKIVLPSCVKRDGILLPSNISWELRDNLFYLPNESSPFTGTTACRILGGDESWYEEEYESHWFVNKLKFKDGIAVFVTEIAFQKNEKKIHELNRTFPDYIYVGKQTYWYGNGQMQLENNYNKDGIEDGRHAEWYENGQIKQEQNYKDGIEDGRYAEWYENGQKIGELNFKDGNLDGKGTVWYENGQIKSEVIWKDGKENGKFTEWYENGQKMYEVNYKDGELDGKDTDWDENGQIESESNWKDGECISGDCPS